MNWPKALVTRSAMLVLPLPGAPNRNRPRPELIAGPSRAIIFGLISKSSKARCKSLGRRMLLGDRLQLDTLAM